MTAARVRAARAYAKLERSELAEALSLSPSTIDYIEGKRASLRAVSDHELDIVAEKCGVPRSFLDGGFTPPHRADRHEIVQSLRAAAQQITDVADLLAAEPATSPAGAPAVPPLDVESPDLAGALDELQTRQQGKQTADGGDAPVPRQRHKRA